MDRSELGAKLDVMKIALERRVALRRELDELENFIKMGEALLKKATGASAEAKACEMSSGSEVRRQQQMARASFGSQTTTDSFQFQGLLQNEREKRASVA